MPGIGEVPVEATKAAVWAAASGGRMVRGVGENILHRVQPGYIPPEVVARQAVLKRFENRLAVVDLINEDTPEDELEVQAYTTADRLVDEGVIAQHTAVELRPVLPADTLEDPELNRKRARTVELLQLAFEEDHNVLAIPQPHPIMPSEHRDSPIDPQVAWGTLAYELDGLWRQLSDRDRRDDEPAMLGITGAAYERVMFGGHIAIRDERSQDLVPLELVDEPDGDLLVLEHVGERPEQNRLVLH